MSIKLIIDQNLLFSQDRTSPSVMDSAISGTFWMTDKQKIGKVSERAASMNGLETYRQNL